MKSIKKMVLVSAFAGTCLAPHAQTTSPAIPADPAIEANIREWLQKMTLEQKIGQMCEITIDVVSDLETSRKKGFCLSEAMLDTVIGKYKVGSLLNVPLGVAQKKGEVGGSYQTDTGKIDEGDRYSLHLWGRSDSWNDLHIGRNDVSARHQHGSHLQPRANEKRCRNLRL